MSKTSIPKNWFAWYNMMSSPTTLHVRGDLDVGNESESATIEFDSILKKFPPVLVLKVVPRTIFIPRDEGDTVISLHYSETTGPNTYDSIIIVFPNGETEKIDNITYAY
jgi:hypothetical protein